MNSSSSSTGWLDEFEDTLPIPEPEFLLHEINTNDSKSKRSSLPQRPTPPSVAPSKRALPPQTSNPFQTPSYSSSSSISSHPPPPTLPSPSSVSASASSLRTKSNSRAMDQQQQKQPKHDPDHNVFDIRDIIRDEYTLYPDRFEPCHGTTISKVIPSGLCAAAAKLVPDGKDYKAMWSKLVEESKVVFGEPIMDSILSDLAYMQEPIAAFLNKQAVVPDAKANNINILLKVLRSQNVISGLTFKLNHLFVLYVVSWYQFLIAKMIIGSTKGAVHYSKTVARLRLKNALVQARSIESTGAKPDGKKALPSGVTTTCMFATGNTTNETKGLMVYDVTFDSYRFPAPEKPEFVHTLSNGATIGRRSSSLSSSSSSSSVIPFTPPVEREKIKLTMSSISIGNIIVAIIPTLLNIGGLVAYANKMNYQDIAKLTEEQRANPDNKIAIRGRRWKELSKAIHLGTQMMLAIFGTSHQAIHLNNITKGGGNGNNGGEDGKGKGKGKRKRNEVGEDGETVGPDGEMGYDLDDDDDDDEEYIAPETQEDRDFRAPDDEEEEEEGEEEEEE